MASFQAATNSAPVKWAQRKDSIYLTIALRDVKNEQVSLTDKTLKFSGDSDGKHWAIELEFLKDVDAEGSIFKVNPASVHFNIIKKNQDEEFWSRLLMDKAKEKNNVSADWSRWVDEDEGPEDFNMDGLDGGMGMGGMGGMGGMPGMGGMGGMGGMMGGMPGMGGMGGMDFEKMMAQMKAGGGMPGMGGMGDDEGFEGEEGGDSDDDADVPDLETPK